jgi:deazaflavin-dependent oxidoreductase (nitroreductase family)
MSSNDARQNWNQQIIEEFRANAGNVEQFGGKTLVLLHHTGAKSGTEYISPLRALPLPDGAWVITASNGGRDTHPAWYHNLRANPDTVAETPGEDDVRTLRVTARVADGAERERLFADLVAAAPAFGDYQKATSRRIPVVVLEPVG